MNTKVICSVFKRNFFGYLANPTGYVFICVFVLLSSIAAFLTDEFFNANLANLDQLNTWFPLIMLVFVPAITMGIWADERRQGTDELLLTIPASDFDIVSGKFLAATAIFFVSLVFSAICNVIVLKYLGSPDIGLFLCTYLGYFLVGIAMIAIGMTASFLTGNLTVAYILGAIFNTPLIALQWTDATVADVPFKSFCIPAQFELFGRGIANVSGIVYFLAITAVMLYLGMILIGRRHWKTSGLASPAAYHAALRTISLLVIVLSFVFIFRQHDLRADLTEEKLSTLSPETIKLLKELKPQYPVVIEAYLSGDVPESHTQTRLDIISILDEIQSICGKNVSVRSHYNIKPNTEEALIANQRFDIKPQDVSFAARGKREFKSIFLGVAFRSGLDSLTLPFIDRGLSVEYELAHALCSVTTPQKKRIGILKTDAPLYGRFDIQTVSMSPPWAIIEELQKQYNVVEVDPAQPIREKYDVLVAVQPSALGVEELNNFIEVVKSGQPTVIFEDPLPVYVRGVPGTAEPRQAGGNPMMMRGQQPKGSIDPLWDVLGVSLEAGQAVWQEYSPIRKIQQIPKGFVFLDRSLAAEKKLPFNENDAVSSALEYMMLPFPGHLTKQPHTPLTVEPLLTTFQQPAGVVLAQAVRQGVSWERQCIAEQQPEILAMRIRGELAPPAASELKEGEKPVKPEPTQINVLLVADIDMLGDMLFNLRRIGNEPGSGINLNFDNVTFVLNAIDSVAGDERFLIVRNRRPKHRTLSRFDENTDEIRKVTNDKRKALQDDFEKKVKDEESKLEADMKKLETDYKSGAVNEEEAVRRVLTAKMSAEKRLESEKEKAQRQLNIDMEKADVELNEYISKVQGQYKFYAVALPPIPPLFIGFAVFFLRRIREREGIPVTRRKKN